MKKKLLIALGILVAAIGVICIIAAFRPDDLNVTRSTTTSASPDAVFRIVNDFRRWDEWSPWSRLDPDMTKTLEGPPEGVGAKYHWSGNMEVGEGTTTLVESKPSEKVGMKLNFVRPMAGEADVQLTFTPGAGGTKITWAMHSKQPFIGKIFGLFVDCEKMCGDQFLEGLANLKRIAETPAQPGT